MIFHFDKKKEKSETLSESFASLNKMLLIAFNSKQSFRVEISKLGKTNAQLRGFHRLIQILLPYFKEWTGSAWDMDSVKDLIKSRSGFVKRFKGLDIPRSCKTATIEEMTALIKEAEVFAAEMDIKDCYLESHEWQELQNYYQNR